MPRADRNSRFGTSKAARSFSVGIGRNRSPNPHSIGCASIRCEPCTWKPSRWGDPVVGVPVPPQSVWERYVTAPPLAPQEAEEAFLLSFYRDRLIAKVTMQHRNQWIAMQLFGQRFLTPALNYWNLLPFEERGPIGLVFPPEVNALALASVRAARRAIATSPDHPDGYFYLSLAYRTFATDDFYQDVQQMVTTGSLARCKVRISDDPAQKRSIPYAQEVVRQLRETHMRTLQ